jgi:hypothetical protein
MSSSAPYEYAIERDEQRPGFLDVALVRREAEHRRFGHLGHRQGGDGLVLYHHVFRPMQEWSEIEHYVAQLEQVAEHARSGTLGCFVETSPSAGKVDVVLYERWFDGQRLRCDELARREFDPGDEQALVASAEFQAELQAWADRRNDEREASYLDASIADAERLARESDQEAAAKELAQILASETGAV